MADKKPLQSHTLFHTRKKYQQIITNYKQVLLKIVYSLQCYFSIIYILLLYMYMCVYMCVCIYIYIYILWRVGCLPHIIIVTPSLDRRPSPGSRREGVCVRAGALKQPGLSVCDELWSEVRNILSTRTFESRSAKWTNLFPSHFAHFSKT